MKAARNFVYGTEDERFEFVVGEEIPDDMIADLPDHLILEKVARSNPNSLSREQLLVMAGIEDDPGASEEFNEEEFMEGLRNFNSKPDLVAWANEILGLELSASDGTRDELEETITAAARPQESEEE